MRVLEITLIAMLLASCTDREAALRNDAYRIHSCAQAHEGTLYGCIDLAGGAEDICNMIAGHSLRKCYDALPEFAEGADFQNKGLLVREGLFRP